MGIGIAPFLFVALLAPGPDDKPIKVDPSLLVGVWEQVKARGEVPAGSTNEFTANGQYHFRPKANNISEYHSTYKVQGDQIAIESMNPGLVPGLEVKVVELTGTKLVLGFGGDDNREFRRAGGARAAGPRLGQRTATFNLGVPPSKAGGGRWTTVSSAEDGYRVEMPGPPNSESDEEGLGFSLKTRVHRSADAEYVLIVATAPTAFPDDNEKVVETMVVKFAERFGTDVEIVSRVGSGIGPTTGRDYTINIKRPEIGQCSARVLVIPAVKTAYALLALPTRAEPIPGDQVSKFFGSIQLTNPAYLKTFGLHASPGRSGPTTSNARRTAGGMTPPRDPSVVWGNEVDPDGDVQFRPEGPTMTLTIPPSAHLLAPERDKMNAPRVVMPVGGDFAVSVRVDGRFDPSEKSTTKGLSSRQSGGLVVWKDPKNYLVFQRRASGDNDGGKDQNQVVLEELANGSKGATVRQPIGSGSVFLRIDRRGNRIKAESSTDGRRWVEVKPIDTTWLDGQVEVGVIATNTSTTPHSVTFNGYKLMPR